jgi:hypothetical protein
LLGRFLKLLGGSGVALVSRRTRVLGTPPKDPLVLGGNLGLVLFKKIFQLMLEGIVDGVARLLRSGRGVRLWPAPEEPSDLALPSAARQTARPAVVLPPF